MDGRLWYSCLACRHGHVVAGHRPTATCPTCEELAAERYDGPMMRLLRLRERRYHAAQRLARLVTGAHAGDRTAVGAA